MELSRSQQLAIDYITNYARNHNLEAKAIINHILKMSNIPGDIFMTAVNSLKANAQIGLHFHPDRPVTPQKSVAESLLDSGFYKNKFETKTTTEIWSPRLDAASGWAITALWFMLLFVKTGSIEALLVHVSGLPSGSNREGNLRGVSRYPCGFAGRDSNASGITEFRRETSITISRRRYTVQFH